MSHPDNPTGKIDDRIGVSTILHWDTVQEFQIPTTLAEAKALEHGIVGDDLSDEYYRKQPTSALRQRQIHRHKLVLMMITYLEYFQTFDQTSSLLLSEAMQLDALSESVNDFTRTAQQVFDMVSPDIRVRLSESLVQHFRQFTGKERENS